MQGSALLTSVLFLVFGGGTGHWFVSAQEHPQVASKGPTVHELGAMAATVELATNPVSVRIPLTNDAANQITGALAPSSRTKLVLVLSGIDFDKRPEVHYQIYLNLPQNEKPDYKSIYFVGNLAFFSFQPHGGNPDHPPVVNFDITRTVRDLVSRKLWENTQLSVTFVMQWLLDAKDRPRPVPPGVRVRFTTAKIVAISP